jgi:hypothetical protein
MEEAAQGEIQPSVHRRNVGQRVVVELRPADVTVHPLEQADEVQPIRPLDGRAIGRRARRPAGDRPRAGHRQLGIDAGDVRDRFRLQVEDGGILAEVGDLDYSDAPGPVVDQERLIAFTAEARGGSLDAEEPSGNLRDFVCRETRRWCLEHVHGCPA